MKLLCLMILPVLAGPAPQSKLEKRVNELLKKPPKAVKLPIEYREIRGLPGQFQWHIGDTHWWVRTHGPNEEYSMARLDKTKKYTITGIVLEQNYGVVEIWMQERASEPDK